MEAEDVDEEELVVYHGGRVQEEVVILVGGKASPVVLDV